jgi:hypothetical protein
MGTRSLTRIFDNEREIACIYRQFDGYKSAHGAELAEFVGSRRFVNGISGSRTEVFNGMGCFAALLVAHLKGDDAGGIYLYPPASSDVGEEFVYEVHGGIDGFQMKPITVKCFAYGEEAFSGTPDEFKTWCATEDEAA